MTRTYARPYIPAIIRSACYVPLGEDTNVGLSEAEATRLRYHQKAERDRWAKIARRAVRIAADHVRRHQFSWFRQTALSPTAKKCPEDCTRRAFDGTGATSETETSPGTLADRIADPHSTNTQAALRLFQGTNGGPGHRKNIVIRFDATKNKPRKLARRDEKHGISYLARFFAWIAARDCRDDALIRSLRQAVFVPLPGLNHPEAFMRTDLVVSHAVKFSLGLGASSRRRLRGSDAQHAAMRH